MAAGLRAVLATAAVALMLSAAAAPAQVRHWCDTTFTPPIATSTHTSCSYARAVAHAWFWRNPVGTSSARFHLRRYTVTCRFDGYEWVTCKGTGIRIRFLDDGGSA